MKHSLRSQSLDDPNLLQAISAGAVGVLPTDTVYGLVASAANRSAVDRLYKLKHRHQKPGTIIAANIDHLVDLGIPRRYLKAVEQFWPGAVSVIVPTGMDLSYLHLGKVSLACRIPDSAAIHEFLYKTGPLLTTSANHPNLPPASNLAQAEKYFGDSVDFYVDGGDLGDHQPSTIIQIIDDAVHVVRQGSVKIDV